MSSDDEVIEEEVYAEGNTVFFFCDVSESSIRTMCRLLKKVSISHDNIKLCINSHGGDLYAGFAGMDYIRYIISQNIRIETFVFGFCASAATFLLMGGTKRTMGKNSYAMIHQMSDTIGGTYCELQAEMRNNKKFMKHFRKLYLENTTIPEEYLEKLLSRDIVLSANKCLQYGIVNELV
jgi:ATP-dependent Clp endopeptidase proteolytic subunit ClpP